MSYEINGFEIEEFNVHGIKDGAKTSTCPVCSHTRKKKTDKCMSVFWDTGLGNCNHCGSRVQLHTYKKAKDNFIKNYSKPTPKESTEISKVVSDWFQSERGISLETLKKLKVSNGIKWMPKAKKEIQVIEFNYYLFGELTNVKSRGKNKDFMFGKDCELILYNLDSIIGSKTAIIVEGEPDALSFVESGRNHVVSVPNGFTLPKLDGSNSINLSFLDAYYGILEEIETFYIAVDNDEPGRHGQKELVRRLGAEKCMLVDFKDCKDANDYLLKYGKEALNKTIDDATPVPLEGIITISDVREDLEDFWINGAKKGHTVGMQSFDNNASFEFKQHTLLVAAPGSGKSDLIDHFITSFAVNYGHKVGICSTENHPEHLHYNKLFRKIQGTTPRPGKVRSEETNNTFNFIDEHFFHVKVDGRYYLEDVLAKFAELVTRKGVRWFVLDPFNKINIKGMSKNDMNTYTAEYHQMIDAFQIKYNVHIFLVVHPVKLPLKEGSDKTLIMPTAYHIKGGGEHFDMSYNIIGMVRDYENECVQIRTLKWKFQHLGTAGVDTYYGWNINNGRYTEPDGYYDGTGTEKPSFTWDNTNWLTGKPNEDSFQLPMGTTAEAFKEQDDKEFDDWYKTDVIQDEIPF